MSNIIGKINNPEQFVKYTGQETTTATTTVNNDTRKISVEVKSSAVSKIDDVKVDNVSVVQNKVANINLQPTRDLITAEATARTNADTTLQTNITNEATTRSNADTDLQGQINNLKNIGRYLSLWNASTGKPYDDPTTALPYEYRTGDYYRVGTVAAQGQTNYKPNGSSYTGQASTTVETNTLSIGDVYYYDNNTWQLQQSSERVVNFSQIAGQPSENTNLNTALNNKVGKFSSQSDFTVYAQHGSTIYPIKYDTQNIADSLVARDINSNITANAVGVYDGIGGGVSFIDSQSNTTWLTGDDVKLLKNASVNAAKDTIVKRGSYGEVLAKWINTPKINFDSKWLQRGESGTVMPDVNKLYFGGVPLATENYISDSYVQKLPVQSDFVVYGQNQDSVFAVKYDINNVANALVQRDQNGKVNISGINGKIYPTYPTTNTSPQCLSIAANGGNLSWEDYLKITSIAPAYSSSSTYNVGDLVTHDASLYKCNTQISTAEAWDATKWTETNVSSNLGSVEAVSYDADNSRLYGIKIGSTSYNVPPYYNKPADSMFIVGDVNNTTSRSYITSFGLSPNIQVSGCYFGSSISAIKMLNDASQTVFGSNVSVRGSGNYGGKNTALGSYIDMRCNNAIAIGHYSKNYIDLSVSCDGSSSARRTLHLYDPSKIFFRYDDISDGKTSFSDYPDGKTLQQLLDEKQNVLTSISGYDATKAQTLEHDASGNMIWVDK